MLRVGFLYYPTVLIPIRTYTPSAMMRWHYDTVEANYVSLTLYSIILSFDAFRLYLDSTIVGTYYSEESPDGP